jgi:hypothetical protein
LCLKIGLVSLRIQVFVFGKEIATCSTICEGRTNLNTAINKKRHEPFLFTGCHVSSLLHYFKRMQFKPVQKWICCICDQTWFAKPSAMMDRSFCLNCFRTAVCKECFRTCEIGECLFCHQVSLCGDCNTSLSNLYQDQGGLKTFCARRHPKPKLDHKGQIIKRPVAYVESKKSPPLPPSPSSPEVQILSFSKKRRLSVEAISKDDARDAPKNAPKTAPRPAPKIRRRFLSSVKS